MDMLWKFNMEIDNYYLLESFVLIDKPRPNVDVISVIVDPIGVPDTQGHLRLVSNPGRAETCHISIQYDVQTMQWWRLWEYIDDYDYVYLIWHSTNKSTIYSANIEEATQLCVVVCRLQWSRRLS